MYSHTALVLSPENVKKMGPESAPEFSKLTLKNTEYLFGDTPVEKHLDRNHLSLGIYNDTSELVGALCLDCHPNIPALPPWEWDSWLHQKYSIKDIVPISTLWIHYAVWDRRYTTLFLKPMLQHIFQLFDVLEHIAMVCPPGITHLDFIEGITTRVLPNGFSNPFRVQSLFIAKREKFVAHYVIRRAVEEDNDDLVAIIPKVLEEKYGHYYISEILSEEDLERQIIVAEYQGCAVGVLCLNEKVNYDLLNQEFELIPYNGLKKYDVADEVVKAKDSGTNLELATGDSTERLSISIREDSKEETPIMKDEEDVGSEDEFSLVNLSSSLIFNFLYDEHDASEANQSESMTSIESHFSAVVLNEEYQDHVYIADRTADIETEARFKRRESRVEHEEMPVFYGEPNAFTMEICTSLPDHENSLYLLFQAAFECFPDRDYIVVSFPSNSNPCFVAKHFVRVIPRSRSMFHHELYVLHKNAILGRLWARPSIENDVRVISALLKTLIKPLIVEDLMREAVEFETSPMKAFSFLCEKQIIGCAVIIEEGEHEYLELNYNLDPWFDVTSCKFGAIGTLEHFVLSPIFQKHIGFFMRELHRLSDFSVIFYRFKTYDFTYSLKNLPVVNCLTNMVPVLPNPLPEYSKEVLEEYQLPRSLQKRHQPFGLYVSTVRLSSMIRVEVSQRLVVIGAGSTTISFLESLLFGKNPNYLIVFTNVTVVSPHGISYHKPPSAIREMVFVRDGHLDRRYVDSICLKTYVHVVTGVMTLINRKERYIILNDDSYLPYDYLFLMCGEQFQKPPLKKKEILKKRTDFPQNVFIINTEGDAGNAFNALKNLTSGQKQGTMVVFGHYLEACCCLAALLEFGVSPNNLVYVDPTPENTLGQDRHDHLTQFFNNSEVETAVLDEIVRQGITIYQDFNFVEWHLDSSKSFVTSAKFESKYKFVDIELSALFIYYGKGVSARTFQAIARSGLVFNGRLIIDMNCQTNDPQIYGAGPLTMHSKRYYCEHLTHKYFNAQEIGSKLGREIRRKLIAEKYWDLDEEQTQHKPIIKYCKFPGNLYYLDVSKPGQMVPLDVATLKCNYGRVLITGSCKTLDQRGYFRLHLNQFQTVETITCLAKFELHVNNLISLWGKHEILLNHLLLRYDLNMIPDLFEYFEQPWAFAIYHRLFPKVMNEISMILRAAETADGIKLIDEVHQRLEKNEWNPMTKMQSDEIEEICRDTNLMPVIEKKILDFLHDKYMYLPMYAHQMFIRWILHQTQTSPLFVKTTFFTKKFTENISILAPSKYA